MPIMLEQLGLVRYGAYVLVFAILGYSGILELGLGSALVKFSAETHSRESSEDLNRMTSVALRALVLVGMGMAAIVWGFAFFVLPSLSIDALIYREAFSTLIILGARALTSSSLLIPQGLVTGVGDFRSLSQTQMLASSTTFAGTILILLADGGLPELAMLSVGVGSMSALLFARRIQRLVPGSQFRIGGRNVRDTRALLRFALPTAAISLSVMVMYQVDVLLIAFLVSTAAIAQYSLVAKFNQILRELEGLISYVVFPATASLAANGDVHRIRGLLLRGTKYETALMFPVVAATMAFAGPALLVWVGPGYVPLAPLIVLFCSYMLLNPLLGVSWNLLLGMGRLRELLIVSGLLAISNLGLSILLTLWLRSIEAVILGTVVSFILVFPAWFSLSRRAIVVVGSLELIRVALPSYVAALLSFVSGVALTWLHSPDGLLSLTVEMLGALGVGWYAYAMIALSSRERKKLISYVIPISSKDNT